MCILSHLLYPTFTFTDLLLCSWLQLALGRESLADVQYRYTSTFQKIANRYPRENILCITHGMTRLPCRLIGFLSFSGGVRQCIYVSFHGSSCRANSSLGLRTGEGVTQSMSMMWPRAEVHGVTYCAYTHAQRPNFEYADGSCILNGDWELLTESGSASGVFFSPSDS